jgi:hypothetical protein
MMISTLRQVRELASGGVVAVASEPDADRRCVVASSTHRLGILGASASEVEGCMMISAVRGFADWRVAEWCPSRLSQMPTQPALRSLTVSLALARHLGSQRT